MKNKINSMLLSMLFLFIAVMYFFREKTTFVTEINNLYAFLVYFYYFMVFVGFLGFLNGIHCVIGGKKEKWLDDIFKNRDYFFTKILSYLLLLVVAINGNYLLATSSVVIRILWAGLKRNYKDTFGENNENT